MKKFFLFLLGILFLFPGSIYGQACNTSAGSITLAETEFCVGETIIPSLVNANTNPNYTNELIVVDKEGGIIQLGITNGEISGLSAGDYGVHAFNYLNSNPPSILPTLGMLISDISDPIENCYDISAVVSFKVGDPIAPIAVCSDQEILLYLDAAGELSVAPSDFDLGSYDEGCVGIEKIYLEQEIFTCSDIGQRSLELFVEDGVGNIGSCLTQINILDNTGPNVTCLNTEITLSPLGIGGLSISEVLDDVTDACDEDPTLRLEKSDFLCGDLGTQQVKLFAADTYGNESSCSATVTVKDNSPPNVQCKPGVAYLTKDGEVELDAVDFNDGSADLCGGGLSFRIEPVSFNCTTLGSKPLTFFASDQFGNEGSCATSVSILDTIKPDAKCLPMIIDLDESGQGSITAAAVDNSTDNCNIEKVSLAQTSFSCVDIGEKKVLLTVEDFSGNTDTCYADLIIRDKVLPEAICTNTTIYLNEDGQANLSAARINDNSTDNCGEIKVISLSKSFYNCSNIGTQSVTLFVTDGQANTNECEAMVTVLDTFPPVPVCQNTTVFLDENGMGPIDYTDIDNGSTDNCGQIVSYTLTQSLFDCQDLGGQTIYLKVADDRGNIDSCSATVMVLDTFPPEPSCQNVTIYTGVNGSASLLVEDVDAGSLDLCTEIGERYLSENRFTCGQLGQNIIQLYVEDLFGNLDSCSAQVTVLDTLNPIVRCVDQTIYLDDSGMASTSIGEIDNGSTDNCGGIMSRELTQSDFSCQDIGDNTVYLKVEDTHNNIDSCASVITVLDTISPNAQCQDFRLVLGTDGEALLTPDLINNQSSDNCKVDGFELSKTDFICSDLGPNPVFLKVFDQDGNLDSCRSIVTVVDENKPTVFTQNIKVALDENGRVRVDPELINKGSTDNCSIDSLWLSQRDFDCNHVGPNLVTLFVRDIDGNVNDEAAIIEVNDERTPEITCPDNTIINSDFDGTGDCQVVALDDRLDPTDLYDNCGIDTIYHDYETAPARNTLLGATFAVGTHTVSWTVVDKNELELSCSFEVTILDNEAPIANCKDTVLVQLNEQGIAKVDSALVDNGSSDNCEIIQYDLSIVEVDCEMIGYNEVSILIGDANGNLDDCTVVVGVVASEACPQPDFTNAGGPDISDPCTCRGDGAFDEQVVIGPTTNNQVWVVKTTTLLDPNTFLPYSPGTPLLEVPINADSSIYTLSGVHLDGEGYTLTAESPVFEDLSISNLCYYPKPEIIGLDGPICLFTNPIPLEAFVPNEVQGAGYFTINGTETTILAPLALGLGDHIITYHFNAGDPASLNEPADYGCEVTVEKTVNIIETSQFIACNDQVNITSNVSCEILVKPQMILSGNYLCYDDYQVLLAFNNEAVPNPVPAEYAGETLEAVVQHKVSGRLCYGRIQITDVSGPQILECPPHLTDRFICTDLDSILNNPMTLDSTSRLYTGLPKVQDNCTGTTITFQDFLITDGTCSDNAVQTIRRVFTVADQFGNTNACEQLIEFNRPELVFFPQDTTIRIDCNDDPLPVNAQGNLAPSVAGAPYVVNGFGEAIDLVNNRVCGYFLAYEDLQNDLCPSKGSIIRTWRLFNECESRITHNEIQYIEYGDYDAPVLSCPELDLDRDGKSDGIPVFSTSPFDCLANILIPNPQVEECSDYTVSTRVYTWQDRDRFGFPLANPIFVELPNVEYIEGEVRGVPVGEHYFVYTVRDACNNTAMDTCLFRVADITKPVALCEDDIRVSISDLGAQVFPVDVDRGSRDNCDNTNVGLEIRRLVPLECSDTTIAYFTDWGQTADLSCCDVGTLVTLELRVTDQSGNSNICVSRVKVDDNIAPVCRAPFNVSVDCNELSAGFDPSDPQQLQNSFGVPTATDNCEASWMELSPIVDLDNCGIGSIIRTFQVTDNSDNTSVGQCQQVITVDAVYDYSIKFPADTKSTCGEMNSDTVQVFENACDLLAVNIIDSEFQRSPDGCYKIERLYRVIDWCEYDGISDPIVVPRDADCDGIPGDEDVWVYVRPNDTTYFDNNINPFDTIPVEDTTSVSCNGLTYPYGYWNSSGETPSIKSHGFWTYTQFISVIDETAPVINFEEPAPVCSENNFCTTTFSYPFSISENCTINDLSISVIVDLGDDGINDYVLLGDEIGGSYPNYTISGEFDLGNHRFYLTVKDGCNNEGYASLPFSVIDCKAPSPSCQDGIVVELSRLGEPVDVDNDGIEDLATATTSAMSLIARTTDDCSGPVVYSINRVGQMATREQNSMTFTCADEGIVLVEVHAWDALDNHDYCNTFVDVQNNSDACREIPKGAIYGVVMTETEVPIAGVEVSLSGTVLTQVDTDQKGIFNFLELEEGNDFTVTPRLDGNDRIGVTTFDLILIRKHILGSKLLDSPYKMIAADANNSGNISVLDLIQLQKLILGIEVELSNNTSWRFVDANFQFPDRANPFMTYVPNVINLNNLDREYYDANFVAVKIGDVNDSVNPNAVQINNRSSKPSVFLDIEDQMLHAGEQVSIPVYLKDIADLEGFQFGLGYDKERLVLQELESMQLKTENFASFAKEGVITSSWYRNEDAIDHEQPLFALRFEVVSSVNTGDAFFFNSKRIRKEAYSRQEDFMNIKLRFNQKVLEEDFRLLQNWPNPAEDETNISWYLPNATSGSLKVMDASGMVLWDYQGDFQEGMNTYRLTTSSFPAGLLYYRFESNEYRGTKKMVIIQK